MSKTINRIIQLLVALNLSARQFDISIGSSNGYTLRMSKNNASVGSDVIERILKEYPQVNLVWLITGKGDLFMSQIPSKPTQSKSEIDAFINERIDKETALSEKNKARLIADVQKEIDDLLRHN